MAPKYARIHLEPAGQLCAKGPFAGLHRIIRLHLGLLWVAVPALDLNLPFPRTRDISRSSALAKLSCRPTNAALHLLLPCLPARKPALLWMTQLLR